MISTKNTQSLSDFRQQAGKTLARINRTGEAEILTVNGKARAVLLSPARYDELEKEAQLSKDVAVMKIAVAQLNQGQGRPATEFLDELRGELLKRKAALMKRPSK